MSRIKDNLAAFHLAMDSIANPVESKRLQTWIASNNLGTWHLAVLRELRGDKTGTVMSRHFVTACSGRQLGGAWGYTTRNDTPNPALCCTRCVALIGRATG